MLHTLSKVMQEAKTILTRYENTLDAHENVPEHDLNALRRQYAALKALADEVPVHDSKFTNASATLQAAIPTCEQLAATSNVPEQDVAQWQDQCTNAEQRWDDIKKRLNARVASLDKLIPMKEKSIKSRFFKPIFYLFNF